MLTHMTVRNVRDALARGMATLRVSGHPEASRVGSVLVLPGPMVTETICPWERVLIDPARDANPFFHIMEAFWMLAGRRDVESISLYNKGFINYSDDGVNYHAAYGHRWRSHFGVDQIVGAVEELRRDPGSRRVTIAMWDPAADLQGQGLDLPCNTTIYLRLRPEMVPIGAEGVSPPPPYLDMTVTCRSNDAIWGAHGANAVHFSVLMELLASLLGARMGRLYQLSNNYHMYTEVADRVGVLEEPAIGTYPGTIPLFGDMSDDDPRDVLGEIERLWDRPTECWDELDIIPESTVSLVGNTAAAWAAWKSKDIDLALGHVRDIDHNDWHQAMTEWLERRRK